MVRAIQRFSKGQRQLIFILIFGIGLFALLASTVLLGLSIISPATESVALVDSVTVSEFAALPDDDAYPAALAIGGDGTVYTGSFVSGALWAIDAAGRAREIPNTRAAIGSVIGLTVMPDGALLVIDQLDANPVTGGAVIKRVTPDGEIRIFAGMDDEQGFVAPDDIALDAQGNIYVSDRGRAQVLRFAPDGSRTVWWRPPRLTDQRRPEPTGLAYDPLHDAILVTDPQVNAIYRVAIDSGTTETLYLHGDRPTPPGFDGVTVTPDGRIYVAALEQNGIALLRDGELHYIAGLFRGSSDVDYHDNRLYVTNFDQFSLVLTVSKPRLPFALDVIELS